MNITTAREIAFQVALGRRDNYSQYELSCAAQRLHTSMPKHGHYVVAYDRKAAKTVRDAAGRGVNKED